MELEVPWGEEEFSSKPKCKGNIEKGGSNFRHMYGDTQEFEVVQQGQCMDTKRDTENGKYLCGIISSTHSISNFHMYADLVYQDHIWSRQKVEGR